MGISTNKQTRVGRQAKQYIINCIDSDPYDVETTTDFEKLQFLYNTFTHEYDFMIRQVGEYKAFTEWIMGLPTVFGIVFTNYDILELAKAWGSLKKTDTERRENDIIENYWNFITHHTFQLFRKYKITS